MKHEVSLPCSQQPVTGPYPEPDESSPHTPTLFPNIRCSIIFPSTARSSEWSLTCRFSDWKNSILMGIGPNKYCLLFPWRWG
jgi:hypothetical protein